MFLEALIGVHCTDGVNRSGYLVCRFLIENLGWSSHEALEGVFCLILSLIFIQHLNALEVIPSQMAPMCRNCTRRLKELVKTRLVLKKNVWREFILLFG